MRYVTFRVGRRLRAGVVYHKQHVLDLEMGFFRKFRRPFSFPGLLPFLQANGPELLAKIDLGEIGEAKDALYPLADVVLEAPIPRPPKIVCVGLNYRGHAAEQKRSPPETPLLFLKAPNITIGQGGTIRRPPEAPNCVDFEVELAAVVGKAGSRIPREAARQHIFGYTILLDITARDVQKEDRQWFRGKSFDTFAPMGPWIVTPEQVPEDATIELRLNGNIMQSCRIDDMVFDPAYLVAYASSVCPLEVGDVISTGTPAGVGMFREPPVFLRAGDEIEAEIQGIGVLRANVE